VVRSWGRFWGRQCHEDLRDQGTDLYFFRLRLKEEVEVLKHLSQAAVREGFNGRHPNVLSYIDSWEEDEALFIRTELCEMGNLSRFLWEYGKKYPRLDEAIVWKIIADLSNVSVALVGRLTGR